MVVGQHALGNNSLKECLNQILSGIIMPDQRETSSPQSKYHIYCFSHTLALMKLVKVTTASVYETSCLHAQAYVACTYGEAQKQAFNIHMPSPPQQ